jgi:predicted DNA binding CopG/RHH family protein
MQAAEEQELRNRDAVVPWWECAPFTGTPGFSSALSAAAAPARDAARAMPNADRATLWHGAGTDFDATADTANLDTATFSYEGALLAAMRSSEAEAGGIAVDNAWLEDQAHAAPVRTELPVAASAQEEKRSASVTVRLSAAECALLKQRAAEAGLTLSAYLRSCTFEAEALRTQVKQAIQELRGEMRGEVRGQAGGEWRGQPHADALEKLPAHAECAAPATLAEDSPRPWWRRRASQKDLPAQP